MGHFAVAWYFYHSKKTFFLSDFVFRKRKRRKVVERQPLFISIGTVSHLIFSEYCVASPIHSTADRVGK